MSKSMDYLNRVFNSKLNNEQTRLQEIYLKKNKIIIYGIENLIEKSCIGEINQSFVKKNS